MYIQDIAICLSIYKIGAVLMVGNEDWEWAEGHGGE